MGVSGNSLSRSVWPNFNDKKGWASYRLPEVPFHLLILKGGARPGSLEGAHEE